MGLSLKMFGGFAVLNSSGTVVSLRLRKTRALLAYLALNADIPQPRERLMALLWSDRSAHQARQSLNDALKSIRQLGNDEELTLLDSDSEQVTLQGAALESDVERFQALRNYDPAAAAALYDGPFLDGLSIPDPAFEDWLTTLRSGFETDVCDALRRAANSTAGQGNTDRAIAFIRRLLAIDPLREDGHRDLMQYLHKSGDRTAALRQYQVCVDTLKAELRVAPDAATQAVFDEIRQDALSPKQNSTLTPEGESQMTRAATPSPVAGKFGRSHWAAAFAVVFSVIAAVVIIWIEPWNSSARSTPQEPVSLSAAVKPSIAVLPFENLSGDPEQEYFSDGITGDLITDLSKVSGLFVIARNSSFAYKGRARDLREVGRELGVRYLLEGSVRKSGDRIRINAELIDARTAAGIWAERFDRKLEDVFALQDDVTRKIVAALAVTLKPAEERRRSRPAKIDPVAYDYFLRGIEQLRRYTPATNVEARELFHEAMNADPRFARAIAGIGFSHMMDIFLGVKVDRAKTLDLAKRYVTTALDIDDTVPAVYIALSALERRLGNYDEGVRAGRRAIELDPNYADGYSAVASSLISAGRPEEALKAILTALRLDPQRPAFNLTLLGGALFTLGRYKEATKVLEEAVEKNPAFIDGHRLLAASYAHLGRMDDAAWSAAEILTLQPDFSISKERARHYYKRQEDLKRYVDGLRKAGLPE